MNIKAIFASLTCTFFFSLFAIQNAIAANVVSHAPIEAQAYIIEPTDGATLPETFTVQFGLSEMDLAPAGVEQDNAGHHHLLIDQAELPDLTSSLPATEQISSLAKLKPKQSSPSLLENILYSWF